MQKNYYLSNRVYTLYALQKRKTLHMRLKYKVFIKNKTKLKMIDALKSYNEFNFLKAEIIFFQKKKKNSILHFRCN